MGVGRGVESRLLQDLEPRLGFLLTGKGVGTISLFPMEREGNRDEQRWAFETSYTQLIVSTAQHLILIQCL